MPSLQSFCTSEISGEKLCASRKATILLYELQGRHYVARAGFKPFMLEELLLMSMAKVQFCYN